MTTEMKVAVVTGILAFVGAITGNYVVAHLDEQKSDRQFKQQFRVHILDKRLAIFEQCTNARAQLGRAKVLKQYQDAMLQYLNADKASNLSFQKQGPPDSLFKIQKDLNSIQTEYGDCLLSSASLFGPKTNKAAQAIFSEEAFDVDDAKHGALLDALFTAMVEETTYRGNLP